MEEFIKGCDEDNKPRIKKEVVRKKLIEILDDGEDSPENLLNQMYSEESNLAKKNRLLQILKYENDEKKEEQIKMQVVDIEAEERNALLRDLKDSEPEIEKPSKECLNVKNEAVSYAATESKIQVIIDERIVGMVDITEDKPKEIRFKKGVLEIKDDDVSVTQSSSKQDPNSIKMEKVAVKRKQKEETKRQWKKIDRKDFAKNLDIFVTIEQGKIDETFNLPLTENHKLYIPPEIVNHYVDKIKNNVNSKQVLHEICKKLKWNLPTYINIPRKTDKRFLFAIELEGYTFFANKKSDQKKMAMTEIAKKTVEWLFCKRFD